MSRPHKTESSEASLRGGQTRSSEEGVVMTSESRGLLEVAKRSQPKRRNSRPRKTRKAHAVSREEVENAWRRVRAKGGKGGVDGESIKSFEGKLSKNLYKLWNRMGSGSYHPQAVLRVEIPKGDGSKRELGIPTIMDRVAQEVVRARLEPVVEKFFHRDSYGYRPGKSAIEAVRSCRGRCWEYDWVLDVDIKKFFDSIDHELMMKAVRHHCQEKWVLLYIRRWLEAEVEHKDGRREKPVKGTPQGGVISPLLANLYLHYAFDHWMERSFPGVKFERYADDIVIHCRSEEESEQIKQSLEQRLGECGLSLHPDKTKVVYCKDGKRKGRYPQKKFTFVGYTFQARGSLNGKTGKTFTGFLPAASKEAGKRLRDKLKRSRIFSMRHLSVEELAEQVNPAIRGWYGYFIHFYRSELCGMTSWLNLRLICWLRSKYKLGWHAADRFLTRLRRQQPRLFAHWDLRASRGAV